LTAMAHEAETMYTDQDSAGGSGPLRVAIVSSRPLLRRALGHFVCGLPDASIAIEEATLGALSRVDLVADVLLVDLQNGDDLKELEKFRVRTVCLVMASNPGPPLLPPPSLVLPWSANLDLVRAALHQTLPASVLSATLTRRQTEVIRMASSGLRTRAIAGALMIAEGTVKRHLSAAYDTLQARSRIDAINRARLLGLIE
jgi:DNA-binding CsgD family transcriptional regulator